MRDEEWTMKDGKTIMIADMTEEHAKNTLRMIVRQNREAGFDFCSSQYGEFEITPSASEANGTE